MKAFIVGMAAILVIAIGSAVILETTRVSTADTYATQNVRLPAPH